MDQCSVFLQYVHVHAFLPFGYDRMKHEKMKMKWHLLFRFFGVLRRQTNEPLTL